MRYRKPKDSDESKKVYVIPEFRKEPDIEKLGRALLMLAQRLGQDSASDTKAITNTENHEQGPQPLPEKDGRHE